MLRRGVFQYLPGFLRAMAEKPTEEAPDGVRLFLLRIVESKIVTEDGDNNGVILLGKAPLLSPVDEGLDLLNRQLDWRWLSVGHRICPVSGSPGAA